MAERNVETRLQVLQHRQNSRKAFSTKFTQAKNKRSLQVKCKHNSRWAMNRLWKFLVNLTTAANTPLAPFFTLERRCVSRVTWHTKCIKKQRKNKGTVMSEDRREEGCSLLALTAFPLLCPWFWAVVFVLHNGARIACLDGGSLWQFRGFAVYKHIKECQKAQYRAMCTNTELTGTH